MIILFAPVVVTVTVDKLCDGDVTDKLSVTEKFISSLKVVVSFIVNVGISIVAMFLLFYYSFVYYFIVVRHL